MAKGWRKVSGDVIFSLKVLKFIGVEGQVGVFDPLQDAVIKAVVRSCWGACNSVDEVGRPSLVRPGASYASRAGNLAIGEGNIAFVGTHQCTKVHTQPHVKSSFARRAQGMNK